jgi:glucose/arabinose dehydrogenase
VIRTREPLGYARPMRYPAVALVVLVACGGNKAQGDAAIDASADIDAPVVDAWAIDGPAIAACSPTAGTTVSVRQIGTVSGGAMLVTAPPGDGRLFVLEQDGRIRIFENEQLKTAPFLDISADIAAGGEQGLLGLAFHPNYAGNREFFVFYTTASANVIARYTASTTDLNRADPASKTIILSIPDFAVNHNGGMLEFGADGFLYAGTGDGGGGGDPHRNGQATDRTAASCTTSGCEPLLGKILRLDVDHPANGKPYGIPAGNPFETGGGEPEIFLWGVRNPWRWSFDRMTGDMWIADVGQNVDEELDVLLAGQQAGKNLGWSMYEAARCYGNYTCDPAGITMPKVVKNHSADGWYAIIGGQVYRGSCYPDLQGYYFYSDNVAHTMSRAHLEAGGTVTTVDLPAPVGGWPQSPASLHADARGELYLTTTSGAVYHIEAGP